MFHLPRKEVPQSVSSGWLCSSSLQPTDDHGSQRGGVRCPDGRVVRPSTDRRGADDHLAYRLVTGDRIKSDPPMLFDAIRVVQAVGMVREPELTNDPAEIGAVLAIACANEST
jgi:hypothetical protein